MRVPDFEKQRGGSRGRRLGGTRWPPPPTLSGPGSLSPPFSFLDTDTPGPKSALFSPWTSSGSQQWRIFSFGHPVLPLTSRAPRDINREAGGPESAPQTCDGAAAAQRGAPGAPAPRLGVTPPLPPAGGCAPHPDQLRAILKGRQRLPLPAATSSVGQAQTRDRPQGAALCSLLRRCGLQDGGGPLPLFSERGPGPSLSHVTWFPRSEPHPSHEREHPSCALSLPEPRPRQATAPHHLAMAVGLLFL